MIILPRGIPVTRSTSWAQINNALYNGLSTYQCDNDFVEVRDNRMRVATCMRHEPRMRHISLESSKSIIIRDCRTERSHRGVMVVPSKTSPWEVLFHFFSLLLDLQPQKSLPSHREKLLPLVLYKVIDLHTKTMECSPCAFKSRLKIYVRLGPSGVYDLALVQPDRQLVYYHTLLTSHAEQRHLSMALNCTESQSADHSRDHAFSLRSARITICGP
ncbi:uncharacterized protein EDB93DRAFT_339926 [Suillus bovinus]|uniref:uncharacterized protein n=1 Tax=Suillus bovinus TaxID=48563 RepID=UPI001B87D268|nr:uncharacterized protein EDB93DRAFT_339926 [Suillus bovinus]KAG2150231.1 hypothetical protein EDB93DRAFT_339926 [Suillus bovinus]